MREPAQQFSPLPLRARNVLELLDTSLKVFKQYFWVLIAWSVLLNVIGMATSMWFLLTPLLLGICACCVAAAVRGQRVTFGQCWQFGSQRFGNMLLWYLLTTLISVLVIFGLSLLFFGIAMGGIWAFSGANSQIQLIGGVIGFAVMLVLFSTAMVVVFTWSNIAPIIVCMEENNPEKRVLRRSWDLMQGNWIRATTLVSLLSLASVALFVMMSGGSALIIGLEDVKKAFTGTQGAETPAFWMFFVSLMFGYTGVLILTQPAMLLAMVLFYVDLRIRKEALDLEWTTHVTAPDAPPTSYAPPVAAGAYAPAMGFENLTPQAPQAANYPAAAGSGVSAGMPPVAPPPAYTPTPQAPFQTPIGQAPTPTVSGAGFGVSPAPVAPVMPAAPATQPASSTPYAPATPEASNAAFAPAVFETPAAPATMAWQSLVEEPAEHASQPAPPATQEITCPRCGARSPENYIFCMSCGTRLDSAPPASA